MLRVLQRACIVAVGVHKKLGRCERGTLLRYIVQVHERGNLRRSDCRLGDIYTRRKQGGKIASEQDHFMASWKRALQAISHSARLQTVDADA